jgi:hypothetical protein
MKYLILLSGFIFLCLFRAFGQDSLKTNPIIFADFEFTPLVAGQNNLQLNGSLNYQVKKSLFTLRFLGLGNYDEVANSQYVPEVKNTLYEMGLLYGLRFINGGHSISFSGGLSFNHWIHNVTYEGKLQRTDSRYAGLPFEADYVWFKAKKRKISSTGYGGSIGLKLSGNVSEHSFVSFGVVFGLGFFRKY